MTSLVNLDRILPAAALAALVLAGTANAQCPTDDDAGTNDSCATPQAIGTGATTGLVVTDLSDDFYTFTVPAGMNALIDVLFLNANGDVDCFLFDDNGTCANEIDDGFTSTDNETVTVDNCGMAAATYTLQVNLFSGTCNDYSINITIGPAPGCTACMVPDDSSEDNDTCATAVAAGTSPLSARFVSKTDEDFYTVVVAPGDILSVDVLFTHANGDVDAQLIDTTNCTTVLDASGSTTDNEDLMWNNTTGLAATVAIRVFVWNGSAQDCNTYDLVWSSAPDPCATATDDTFEENDDCSTAAALPMGMTTGLFVRKDNVDDDWYSITVPDQGTLTVDVLFIDANGDIDCRLFDACGGTQVDGSASVTDNEDVTVTNMSGGPITYFLEVYVWGFAAEDCNNYDLNVSVSGGMTNLIPFCFGDGSGTSCNCGNNSAPGHQGGCAHQNGNGSILTGSGNPSVMADTLHFDLTSSVFNSFAVLSSGNNALPQTGACIGCGLAAANLDGLRCVGGVLARHGSRATNSSGATAAGWGPPAAPGTGLILQGFTNTAGAAFGAGSTRHFQVFVRTDPLQGCMQGQNTSNGVTVMIMP